VISSPLNLFSNARVFIDRKFTSFSETGIYLLQYSVILALSLFSFLLFKLGITTITGSFIFSFSLMGFIWPAYLASAFILLVALAHRDFTYLSMDLSFTPLYITEWVLMILLIAAIPRFQSIIKTYKTPTLIILSFFMVGFALFLASGPYWEAKTAIRHFAIVYYSLFAIAIFAHITKPYQFKITLLAMILGSIPHLLGDLLNFLYMTFPATPEQKNLSLRNSFYILTAVGVCLPFIYGGKTGKYFKPVAVFMIAAFIVLCLYTYTKTAIITLFIMLLACLVMKRKVLDRRMKLIIVMTLILPFLITPPGKTYSAYKTFLGTNYIKETRNAVNFLAMRDFVEYPYGIGFGPSIFGDHIRERVINVDNMHSLHNSYISILIRTGIEGGIFFFSILACAFLSGLYSIHMAPSGSPELRLAEAVFFAFLPSTTYPFAHVALQGPFFGTFFWIFIGLLFVFPRLFLGVEETNCRNIYDWVCQLAVKAYGSLRHRILGHPSTGIDETEAA